MPKTLYRYILTEVLRILAVAAVVLVLVIAFGSAIKPMSEGLLGPDTLFKFVACVAPSMLQYALPFAAAMGSTLVYLRMSQDNEVLACQASGLTSRGLVAPMFVLGTLLSVLLLALSGFVAPAFYRQAVQVAKGDIVAVMMRKLDQGQAFEQEGLVLYANSVRACDPPADARRGDWEVEMVLELKGVAALQTDDKGGGAQTSLTATSATATLHHNVHTGDTVVAMRLENPDLAGTMPGTGASEHPGHAGKSHALRADAVDRLSFSLPNPVGDQVEFMPFPRMLELLRESTGFDRVYRATAALSQAVAVEKLRRSVLASLPSGVPLKGPLGRETYVLRAPSAKVLGDGSLELASTPEAKVVVEHRAMPGVAVGRRWEAKDASLAFSVDPVTGEPWIKLRTGTVRVSDAGVSGVASARQEFAFDPLSWPEPLVRDVSGQGADAWLAGTADAALRDPAGPLAEARRRLAEEKAHLRARVFGQLHIRLASALGCGLLLLLGALLSLWRRGSLPLVVYFWCFMTAIFAVLLVNLGGKMAGDGGAKTAAGLALLWAPVAALAVFDFWILRRLRRPGF